MKFSHKDTLSTANLILSTVGKTYGPRGGTVMIDRGFDRFLSTKDGQTVLWELCPENPHQRCILKMIQEAGTRLNRTVGDGTTTFALFTSFLLKELVKLRESGLEDIPEIQSSLEGLSVSVEEILSELRSFPETEKDIESIALRASNGDSKMAKIVSQVLAGTGSKGLVSVEEGKTSRFEISKKLGYKIELGPESSSFLADGKRTLDQPFVVVIDGELGKFQEVSKILEEMTQFPHPLIIFSKGIYGEALKGLISNDRKLELNHGKFEAVAIRVLEGTEILKDLASISGAKIWTPGLFTFSSEYFGAVEKVAMTSDDTTIQAFEDQKEGFLRRVEEIESEEVSEFSHDEDRKNRRIAMLGDGFVVLSVGGFTFPEIKERKARVEDCLSVTRSCFDHGTVPGFLSPFRYLYQVLNENDNRTLRAISTACKNLVLLLCREEISWSELETLDPEWGYDLSSEKVRNLLEEPAILESWEGTISLLHLAFSCASQIVSIEGIIIK